MAHAKTFDSPELAMQSISRERTLRLTAALIAIVGIVIGIVVGVAGAYSDTPDPQPGLQTPH
jgi:hypothetical protein